MHDDSGTDTLTVNSIVERQRRPYVVVTKWAYPYGGGEQFMRQTMRMVQPMHALWLAFYNARNEPFERTVCEPMFDDRPQEAVGDRDESAPSLLCHVIKVGGGFSERRLYNWLRLLRPAVVHYQGALRTEIERAAHTLGVPLIAGFHFWHGMVALNERYNNVRIIEHAMQHRMDELYAHTERRADIVYVSSPFVRDAVEAVGGKRRAARLRVVCAMPATDDVTLTAPHFPATADALFEGDDVQRWPHGYVTIVNIHELKGGRLFLHLLRHKSDDLPLLGVRTDVFETPLDREIDRALREHVAEAQRQQRAPSAFLIGRIDDVRRIYARTGLLLQPSECDETFCRVLVEAQANGVASLCSDYGNVPYLLCDDEARQHCLVESQGLHEDGTHAYYERWRRRTSDLWSLLTDQARARQAQAVRDVNRRNFELLQRRFDAQTHFRQVLADALLAGEERQRRVALIAPWCDQGLGIQTRNYARILSQRGFRVFIFALLPYTGQREQADESEWRLSNVDVYYSPHHREAVLRDELMAFAVRTRVRHVMIAETCWHRVFTMMAELRALHVRTYAIPNVEIVRTDEIEKHRVFDRILLNNDACRALFLRHGFPSSKLQFLGYAAEQRHEESLSTSSSNDDRPPLVDNKGRRVLRLLLLGGRNAVFRKHADVVCRAFLNAVPSDAPMRLVLTSQLSCEPLDALRPQIERRQHQIDLLIGNLSADRVRELYEQCDVVLQVSKHEGLGIGFFEAQQYDKPILTLNVQPHNECAPQSVAWHLQPDALVANSENDSCGVLSAQVSPSTFEPWLRATAGALTADKALAERWWRDEYQPKRQAIGALERQRRQSFERRLIEALTDVQICRSHD